MSAARESRQGGLPRARLGYGRLFVAVAALQLVFTVVVRGFIVPVLTPASHWQHGLASAGDSQFFQEYAVRIVQAFAKVGWAAFDDSRFQGLLHAKVIALLYATTGTSNPWVVFLLNVVLGGLTACVLRALVAASGAPSRAGWWLTLGLCASPLLLFSYSELLREPFIIPWILLFALGLLRLLGSGPEERWPRVAGNVGLTLAGFAVSATLRPYLLIPLAGCVAVAIAVRYLWARAFDSAGLPSWRQGLALGGTLAAMLAVIGLPDLRVQSYEDQADLTVRFEQPSLSGAEPFTREALLAPSWCTVPWQPSRWLPAALDRKFEGLACARQDFLRFCRQDLWGARADRHCDDRELRSAAEVLAHLPRALVFGLVTPDPRMWLSGFGSGGTGLRRAGYVVDGVVAYVMLAGLVVGLGGERWRRRPDIAALVAGLMAVIAIYALAVPSQFLLSRMRLGFYLVLLAMGGVVWVSRPGGTS